jgi:NADH-quinone oxidoreductase subunit G/NADP-reducing hydrogenase subunit HndD
MPNVDAVLTTRELANMIKEMGIDFNALPDRSTQPARHVHGRRGHLRLNRGVMEAALRTVYELVTGRELPLTPARNSHRGLEQVKEAAITIEKPLEDYAFLDGVTVRVAVTSGLAGAESSWTGEGRHFAVSLYRGHGLPGRLHHGRGQPRSDARTCAQSGSGPLQRGRSEGHAQIARKPVRHRALQRLSRTPERA